MSGNFSQMEFFQRFFVETEFLLEYQLISVVCGLFILKFWAWMLRQIERWDSILKIWENSVYFIYMVSWDLSANCCNTEWRHLVLGSKCNGHCFSIVSILEESFPIVSIFKSIENRTNTNQTSPLFKFRAV